MDDYGLDGIYGTNVDVDDTSHMTGSQNPSHVAWHRKIPVPTYQWLIVVGAVGLLWVGYYAFRSDIKVG